MSLHSLCCADGPLRNCSLTGSKWFIIFVRCSYIYHIRCVWDVVELQPYCWSRLVSSWKRRRAVNLCVRLVTRSPHPGDMLLPGRGPVLEILFSSLSRGEKSGKGEWSVSRTGLENWAVSFVWAFHPAWLMMKSARLDDLTSLLWVDKWASLFVFALLLITSSW